MTSMDRHEPFAQTWTGIAIQLYITAVLVALTVCLCTGHLQWNAR